MKPSPPFRLQKFSVAHHRCAHRVGTDGIVLGVWAGQATPARILEVGSGSGLISLMLAQRFAEAKFCGLEIDHASWQHSCENLHLSPFAPRGTFLHADFLQWQSTEHFDLIVSNPPFFAVAQKSDCPARDAARQQHLLPHTHMLERMLAHLPPRGRIALILPLEAWERLMPHAQKIGLCLQRCCYLYAKPDKAPLRIALELGRNPNPELNCTKLCLRRANGSWHPQYRNFTQDFLLL